MKVLLSSLFVCALFFSTLAQQNTTDSTTTKKELWTTSVTEAVSRAKKEGKLILMDFTGSDWCGYCIRLKRNVFNKPEFKQYAKENLILLELDFPRRKTLSAELKQQNYALKRNFLVSGYPTILLVDYRMQTSKLYLENVGYGGQSAEAYVNEIKEASKNYVHNPNPFTALKKKDKELLVYALEHDADVNQTSSGKTLLMLAAERGDQEMVDLLLEYGADASIKTKKGVTAYDLAKKKGHTKLAKYLKSKS